MHPENVPQNVLVFCPSRSVHLQESLSLGGSCFEGVVEGEKVV